MISLPGSVSRPLLATAFCLLSLLFAQAAYAENIAQIVPGLVETLVAESKGKKPLAVHYTSNDGSCSHCVESIEAFHSAAEELGESYRFAEVVMNPWRRFFSDAKALIGFQKSLGFPLRGVPAIMVFAEGQAVRMISGKEKDLTGTLAAVHRIILEQKAAVPGPVSVAKVTSAQLKETVEELSRERPLVLALSSTEEACRHCLHGNRILDETSRFLSESYNFARIDYDPWRSVAKDKALAAYLSKSGYKVKGLPVLLLYSKGKFVGALPGIRENLRYVLAQSLETVQKRP